MKVSPGHTLDYLGPPSPRNQRVNTKKRRKNGSLREKIRAALISGEYDVVELQSSWFVWVCVGCGEDSYK
jgi:hypothetical protein